MSAYELTISDPMFFEGPDPTTAEGVGIVHEPDHPNWHTADFLLNVLSPFKVNCDKVLQLLVSPRYVGDTLEEAMNTFCIVGVVRVMPKITLTAGARYTLDEVEYWAIGSIKRSS